jgi:hypothetical protein
MTKTTCHDCRRVYVAAKVSRDVVHTGPLQDCCNASIVTCASARLTNQCSFRHSSLCHRSYRDTWSNGLCIESGERGLPVSGQAVRFRRRKTSPRWRSGFLSSMYRASTFVRCCRSKSWILMPVQRRNYHPTDEYFLKRGVQALRLNWPHLTPSHQGRPDHRCRPCSGHS